MKLGYFYGRESEQFTFYRIPKLLIKSPEFEKLSDSAKILYGLMLDRMSLSVKNGWFDEENRAYIVFTIENVKDDNESGFFMNEENSYVNDYIDSPEDAIMRSLSGHGCDPELFGF